MIDAVEAPRLEDSFFLLCALSAGAGLIHVEAAVDHIHEYALYAAFFAILAPAQFAWAVALYRRPGRRLLRLGALGSLAVVTLWIVSRTSGLPIGPTPWVPEAIGAPDAIATGDELALALLALVQLAPIRLRHCRLLVACSGICLILLSSMTLMLAGHPH